METWNLFEDHKSCFVEHNFGPARRSEGPGFNARTLTSGKSAGVHIVTLSVGDLEVDVIPTRGMGIHAVRRGNTTFGWQSPVNGPVHPALVPIHDSSGLGWLEGFDEMMVRCGMISNGAPEFDPSGTLVYPVHGRVANLPARNVAVEGDDEADRISIRGIVEETRFLCHHLTLESKILVQNNKVIVSDRVVNNSYRDASIQMLYHSNFGAPVLSEGSEFVAPVAELAPRDPVAAMGIDTWNQFGPPVPGFSEQVYFMKLHSGVNNRSSVLLANHEAQCGVCLSFDVTALPWFVLWKNTAALEDGYVCGLEPATNFPNTRTFEEQQDRVVFLAPGGAHVMELEFDFITNSEEMDVARERVEELQTLEPVIHRHPKPHWSDSRS